VARPRTQFYVDNQKFLEALITYKEDVLAAKEAGHPKPRIPDFIAECFIKIAEHLSFKPNFRNYSFREDMVGDALTDCVAYLENFDPKKSRNAFAYITQVAWFAFLRRIAKEKKQLYTKYKLLQATSELVEYVSQGHDGNAYENTYVEFLRKNMGEVITEFEAKQVRKRRKPKGVVVTVLATSSASTDEGDTQTRLEADCENVLEKILEEVA
jgi:hypothetical protein